MFVIQWLPCKKSKVEFSHLRISVNNNVQIHMYYLKQHSCSPTASLSTSYQISFSWVIRKAEKFCNHQMSCLALSFPEPLRWQDAMFSAWTATTYPELWKMYRWNSSTKESYYASLILQPLLKKQEQLGKVLICFAAPEPSHHRCQ